MQEVDVSKGATNWKHWTGGLRHAFTVELRARALRYLRGLLSSVQRKNGWQLNDLLDERSPDDVQRLLNAAHWDADAVRGNLRAYAVQQLGDEGAFIIAPSMLCPRPAMPSNS